MRRALHRVQILAVSIVVFVAVLVIGLPDDDLTDWGGWS